MSAMDSKRTDFLEAALTKYKACLADQAENDKLVKIGENELTYLKLRDGNLHSLLFHLHVLLFCREYFSVV